MKKSSIWLIVAAGLVVLGLIVTAVALGMTAFDLDALSTVKYETASYDITENFDSISIDRDTADIRFVISDSCKVECYEAQNQQHVTYVENGTLNIKLNDQRHWYEYIGISNRSPQITVYLPTSDYTTLTINGSTGDLDLPHGLLFENILITSSTGDVKCRASATDTVSIDTDTGYIYTEGISAGAIKLSVSTGDIQASNITCEGDVTIKVSTGKAELDNVTCKNLISDGSTGDIELENVIATEKFSIERSTGDVELDGCDAAEIRINTDTGDVEGSLLTDKIFMIKTDTGKVRVPNTTSGGICKVTTDTGDVNIVIR